MRWRSWVPIVVVTGVHLVALIAGAFRPDLVDWPQRDLVVMATYVAAQALFVAVILLTRLPARSLVRPVTRGTTQ